MVQCQLRIVGVNSEASRRIQDEKLTTPPCFPFRRPIYACLSVSSPMANTLSLEGKGFFRLQYMQAYGGREWMYFFL